MFDGLQERLQGVFKRLKGEGRVSEPVMRGALREIRMALLEADVHFKVVKQLVARVEEKALGESVLESLTPAQQVVKIVRDELVAVLGDEGGELGLAGSPAVVLLCGLQGSGKTTTAGKLARRLAGRGRRPLLVAADLRRAAAVEQLVQVGEAVAAPTVVPEDGETVDALADRALREARSRGGDVLLVDTAGRLHVDEELMTELAALAERLEPCETLYVADSMTGQDAVRSAQEFAARLPLTGVVLTKLDGDARGGAALSITSVTGLPIRFVGLGEKAVDLERFQPHRMVSRVLGLGDVLTLIERAEEGLDAGETERLAERLAQRQFDLEDLRDQLAQLKRMGPLSEILKLLPRGGPLRGLDAAQIDDRELVKVEAMIQSMTPQERRNPAIFNAGRRKRVARGAGVTVADVNRLLKQYRQMKKMLKKVRGGWLQGALGRR